ncbi:hypothetical protein [uncultured Roseobacter sp.]|uniref:hypothetical protein n=1 Tax=uncultured Roseobacter sp. TaxID=114847 RepID=UPI00260BC506|nr:hypothetical protein [uncultured Roseobacter sp.]
MFIRTKSRAYGLDGSGVMETKKKIKMTNHQEMQNRLKTAIQQAILAEGKAEGAETVSLTNTDVVQALLEITGFYASIHGFETYSRKELSFKHALTILGHIEQFEKLRRKGKLPMTVIPRSKTN